MSSARYWFHQGYDHEIRIEGTDYAIYQFEGTYAKDGVPRNFPELIDQEETDILNILTDAIEDLF